MVGPRHPPGGLCLLLLLLCQFMEDRSAQGKRGGCAARGGSAAAGASYFSVGGAGSALGTAALGRRWTNLATPGWSGVRRLKAVTLWDRQPSLERGYPLKGKGSEPEPRSVVRVRCSKFWTSCCKLSPGHCPLAAGTARLSCPPFGARRCPGAADVGAGESSPRRFRKLAVAAGVLRVWRIAKRAAGRAAPRAARGSSGQGPLAFACQSFLDLVAKYGAESHSMADFGYRVQTTASTPSSTSRREPAPSDCLAQVLIHAPFHLVETCENVDCGPGKKCRMNKKNKPRCVCAPDCSNITWKGPVCGLDGKTYRNECALLKARCKEQPELEVQYQGKCKKTCRDVFCPGSSTCVVDQTNNAYCVTCNRMCPEPTSSEQYLCGNDGVTYPSACHLRKATCLLGRSIGLAYEGKCIKAKSCEDIQCTGGKKCLWDFKVGRGRCSLCDELCPESKSEEPVCASDNATYASECAMKEAACSSGVLLEVKHSGSCNSISEDTEEEEEDEDQDYSFPISSILEW
eukprot:XP_005619514.1 follistatin [Canis lupus familiaris]